MYPEIEKQSTVTLLRPPSPSYGESHSNSRKMTVDTEDSLDFFQYHRLSPPNDTFAAVSNNTNDNLTVSSIEAGVDPQSQFSVNEDNYGDPYRRASRIFFVISVVSAVLTMILESYMYAVINIHKQRFDSHQRYAEISIYLSLFIFAAIYQIILTIIGLRTKNMLLLTMLCGFYACMLIYTGIQFGEIQNYITVSLPVNWRNATKGTNIAVIGVIAATLVIQIFMIFFILRKNVKWFRYKKIGGDLRIRKMYTIFQVHRSLLIFDFFFFLGFTVQFIVIMIDNKGSVEFILTVCVLPLTLIILLASDYAATRELKQLTVVTIIFFLAGCAYVLFKTIRLFTKYTSAYNIGFTPGGYFPGRKSLLTFAIITLILLFATIVIEIWMLFNYNRGLLPMVNTYYKWLPYHHDVTSTPAHHLPQNISMATLDTEKPPGSLEQVILHPYLALPMIPPAVQNYNRYGSSSNRPINDTDSLLID